MTLTEQLLFVLNANLIRLAQIISRNVGTDDKIDATVAKMADELKEAARAHREA